MVLKRFGASIRLLSSRGSSPFRQGNESFPGEEVRIHETDLEMKENANPSVCSRKVDDSNVKYNEANDVHGNDDYSRGFLNEYLLLWVYPVLWKGFRNSLDPIKDSPPLPSKLQSKNVIPKALKSYKRHRSIYWVMWDVGSKEIVIGLFVSILAGLLTTVARPWLLGLIVQELEDKMNETDGNNSWILQLIGMLCLVLLLEGWTSVIIKHSLTNFGATLFFTVCAGLIQDKSQRVSCVSASSQETSLLGNDVFRTYDNLRFSVLFPMAISGLLGGVVVLVITIGKASIVGLIVMFIILVCNGWISRRASEAEEEDLFAADKRLAIMKQMITGIKAIKLCAWEENFLKQILQAREHEMKCLTVYRVYQQSGVQLGRACPVLCAASSFLYLAISGESVTAAELFAALNVFLSLRLALIIIPECITYFAAAAVSNNRIHAYLNQPDISELHGERNQASNLEQSGGFRWEDSDSSGFLIDGNFRLPAGKSLAVVSQVGNGKTSLLHSIVGELCAASAASKVSCDHERISFIPQQPFILSGTILENIVVDCDLEDLERVINKHNQEKTGRNQTMTTDVQVSLNISDEINKKCINMERVLDVIQRSALEEDLKQLSDGLYTKIGERGVTLSGGQQQRLIIARALYHRPTLLIADDPLAAVDHKVADHLFQHAFMKHLKQNQESHGVEVNSKSESISPDSGPSTQSYNLVMSLNQPRFLPFFDFICKLENGKIVMFEEVNEASLLRAGAEANAGNNTLVQRVESSSTGADDVGKTSKVKVMPLVENSSEEAKETSPNKSDDHHSKPAELIEEDYSASGLVSSHIIIHYMRGMGFGFVFLCLFVGLLTYATMAFNDLWLSKWVDDISTTDGRDQDEIDEENIRFAIVYSIGCFMFLSLLILTSYLFSIATVRSSKSLHEQAMNRLMHAPITWFEQTPSGRITTRFTSDLSSVDQTLSRFCDNLWQLLATLLALIVVVAILVPPIIIVILISLVLYSFQVISVDRANRVLKRQANLYMSPVQLILSEGVDGRVTSRVMGFSQRFRDRFYSAVDNWNRQAFCSLGVINTSMLNSYVLSLLISTSTALYIVLGNRLTPAEAGLALTYSFLIPYFLLHSSFVMTIVMTSLSSLERIMDYVGESVPQEPSWYKDNDPADEWPKSGDIDFDNVSLIYRKGLDPAIKDVSFSIKSGEKIGCIGRTGAGKSSIILLLLRVLDPSNGVIRVDGIDTTTIGLLRLRRAISIIPQRPLLLRGTVKENVAPFGTVGFDELKRALTKAGLLGSVLKTDSEAEIAADKENQIDIVVTKLLDTDADSLSAGQKQLLSLARCLINRDVKILVCDEPTSNVDVVTDKIVQEVLRSEFKHATCITVAHRLETIADSDRILVMEKGEVFQFDSPSVVLTAENKQIFEEQ